MQPCGHAAAGWLAMAKAVHKIASDKSAAIHFLYPDVK
jgi:hypothetical protein